MELREVLELSGVILGSLGSGAAIIFGFSSWLGKVRHTVGTKCPLRAHFGR